MAVTNGNHESTQVVTDEDYEPLGSQEQTYLDEVEARLIESLTSTEPSS